MLALTLVLENVGVEAEGSSTTQRPKVPYANSNLCYIKEDSSEKDPVFQFCSTDADCKDSWLPGIFGSWSKWWYLLCLSPNGKSTTNKTGVCCSPDALKFKKIQRSIAKDFHLNCVITKSSYIDCTYDDDCKRFGGGLRCLRSTAIDGKNMCCNQKAYE